MWLVKLSLRHSSDIRQDADVAGQPAEEDSAAGRPQGGHPETDRLAHFPPHLKLLAGRDGQRRQGCTGTDAARKT
jgi:hypothetical protein